MHAGRPALTVRCAGTDDVVHAVNLARGTETGSFAGRAGMVTSVCGGVYAMDGLSSPDCGMLIDLSPMTAVHVDPDEGLARVQGGALWKDVNRETQAVGLAAPGGMISEMGVAGATLGGGYGWMARKHGLSCDNLVEAEVVCVDGQVRKASRNSNPDLFWAIRGGGASFGVVTSLTFRLHPIGRSVACAMTVYPIEAVAEVLRAWRACVNEAPDEVTSALATVTLPADPELPESVHDRPVAMIGAVYAGDPGAGMSALQPLRELRRPLADLSQPMPFTAVQGAPDRLFPRGHFQAYGRSQYLNQLSDEAIEVIAAKALDRPTPRTMVNAFQMGGAIAKVEREETAFAARSAHFMVSVDGLWTDPAENADHIRWVRSAWNEIRELGEGSTDEALLARLAEVKATYDRANFFRMNRNIAPARTARDQPRTQS
jgi:FAD/FMN-containing dehydrogenase